MPLREFGGDLEVFAATGPGAVLVRAFVPGPAGDAGSCIRHFCTACGVDSGLFERLRLFYASLDGAAGGEVTVAFYVRRDHAYELV